MQQQPVDSDGRRTMLPLATGISEDELGTLIASSVSAQPKILSEILAGDRFLFQSRVYIKCACEMM